MVNIGVLVSGGGTNLQSLINAERGGEIKSGKLRVVISSKPGAYAITRAKEAGIETLTISREDFGDTESFSLAVMDELVRRDVGLVVLAGFLSIISDDFISAFRDRIINVHPALLPSFGGKGYYGLRVHEAALKRGVKVTGATVHFANEVCDGGPIILQKAVDVYPSDTPEILQKRVMEQAEWVILPKAVSLFCDGRLKVENGIVKILEEN